MAKKIKNMLRTNQGFEREIVFILKLWWGISHKICYAKPPCVYFRKLGLLRVKMWLGACLVCFKPKNILKILLRDFSAKLNENNVIFL